MKSLPTGYSASLAWTASGCGANRLQAPPSFRGDAKHRTRNLEIPGLRFAHPGMTARRGYRTTPEMNPALRRGGLISFFRKQCASLPT
ncbi:hypothetical protein SAMN05443248_0426 [Bradyrhizobium erythrophlei]|uniref:Uncharacterized protein n=1 Tax=Bradyrhizobium erythrophlei TaxID=1437360 RepID=A0A1M5HD00_9BRAD|nr:hypothetical protein SAMN05443248_0426 [Bradyrhizobium erythrophlei]